MSDYLYFPINLKDKKHHTYTINCKIFFQLMLTGFKKTRTYSYPFSFCSSFMFVIETVFISEQIKEYWFGALLEISNKYSIKLNTFSIPGLKNRIISEP